MVEYEKLKIERQRMEKASEWRYGTIYNITQSNKEIKKETNKKELY